ncbi:MAG: TIGR00153 family protein [bacterium]|nr:TIGR00153 family protein [bacterium]
MDEVQTCMNTFKECLLVLFEDSTSENARELVERVDKSEEQADELRDKIKLNLYRKALMPEARGDILDLVESIDQIANWAEEISYDIHLQRVVFPETLLDQYRQLAEMNVECYHLLHKAIAQLFTDIEAVFDLVQDVGKLETKIDKLEHELIRKTFDIEERLSYQHLLYRTIKSICDISDRSENVAGKLSILAVKRRI